MIVVDLETTGLNPIENSILSIGAVDLFDPTETFYGECRMRENAKVDPQALEINGFDMEEIRDEDRDSVGELLEKFIEWAKRLEDITLAGHNVGLGAEFLRKAVERCEMEWIFGHKFVDLHSICYLHVLRRDKVRLNGDRRSSLSLDKILKYVGLPERDDHHNALNDAKLGTEAFHRLIWNRKLLNEFKKYDIPVYIDPK